LNAIPVIDPIKLEDGLTAGLTSRQDQDSFTKQRLWTLPYIPKHTSFVPLRGCKRYSLLEAVFSLFQLQKYEGRLYLHTFVESESWNWKVRMQPLSSYFSSSSTIGHEKTSVFSVHSPRILFNLKMSFLDEATDSRNWT